MNISKNIKWELVRQILYYNKIVYLLYEVIVRQVLGLI